MTLRQTPASGGAVLSPANGSRVETLATPSTWDDWFQHAAPQQRALALNLVQQQGLIYSHQLPAVSNGKAATQSADSAASRTIARLLAAKSEPLAPPSCQPIAHFDDALDEVQRLAVERALATPDVFLFQGLPGTGKSRVLAEILRQSAARGQRVLLLGEQSASLDVVLARLAGKPEVFGLRLLETHEKPEALHATTRSFTADEQKKAFVERVATGARGNFDRVQTACRRLGEQQPLWAELATCIERHRVLSDRRNASQPAEDIASAVERDVDAGRIDSPRLAEFAELRRAHLEADAAFSADRKSRQDSLDASRTESAQLAERVAQLNPAYLAKKHHRFWTPAYWANLLNGPLVQEFETLQQQHAAVEQRQAILTQEIEQLQRQADQERENYQNVRAALIAGEVSARQEVRQADLDNLNTELAQLEASWRSHCETLGADPLEKTTDAIASAQDAWHHRKKIGEEECQFAHQWVKFVEDAAPQWASRLGGVANVVAATIRRWQDDSRVRESVSGPFDLLVIEDAETLTDVDLLKLAGQAERCVLAATSLFDVPPAPSDKGSGSRVVGRPQASPCWHRLWQALDSHSWPHAWRREEGRLVCQLMPLSDDDCQHLESECLADAADIELCILQRPEARPCLAQVRFGTETRFVDAFAFMVREVQEFPLQPLGRTGWWHEDESRIRRHLGPTQPHDWLEIEPGVRLAACEDAARVSAVEFDKAAGWTRARADAWLQRHRAVGDCERTTFLQVPYRFQPALAPHVTSVVGHAWLGCGDANHDRSIEFQAVPSSPRRDWPTDPAGLELDLSQPRITDKLPAGVRHGLPTRGYVNYAEAQILIRRLEAWSQQEATAARQVAVLALYEGQAILLRRLIEQSETLRARRHPLEVALPSKLHQHEFDFVFLSLTRSQQRGVSSFGDDIRELPIALTRARTRLIVFGDPGAIATRAGCDTQVNRQTAHEARQEQLHLARFADCVRPKAEPALNGANGSH